jgi:hypothetical protein
MRCSFSAAIVICFLVTSVYFKGLNELLLLFNTSANFNEA